MDNLQENLSSFSINGQEENNLKNMECPVCQENAEKMCSACKSVAYCCVDHQKADWKNHKKVCQPFTIQKIEGMGMGCVATRDLKAGFIVMEENTVIQAPAWNCWSRIPTEGRKCLACGNWMRTMRPCSTCHWPICSVQCEQNPRHMNNECPEFVSRKIKYPAPRGWHDGMLTMCMRANVMKTRDPKSFAQLMALQDYYGIPSADEKFQEDADLPAGMYDVLKGPNSMDRDEFRKLIRIVMVNSIKGGYLASIDPREGSGASNISYMIYPTISRINHSCFPNCNIAIGPDPDNKMQIFMTLPVKKGEQLIRNHFECCSTLPTKFRQSHITSGGFTCKCKRCLDSTELGTFLSGIKCFSCSRYLSADSDKGEVGFLLPADPLDPSPDPVYECHRCHVKVPYSKVMKLLPSVVLRVLRSIDFFTDHNKSTGITPGSFEKFLINIEEDPKFKEYLHKNHGIIQRVIRPVVRAQENALNTMTEQDLKNRRRRLEFLLAMDEKLYPGLHKLRLDDLRMMERTCMALLGHCKGLERADEEQELLRTAQKAQKEVIKFVSLEFSFYSEDERRTEKQKAVEMLKLYEDHAKQLHWLSQATWLDNL